MSDIVFVSYEAEDQQRASMIMAALREAGLLVLGDGELPQGADRATAVASAMQTSYVVLVLWTEASTTPSDGRHVLNDAPVAVERNAYLGAVLDEGIALPFGFAGLQSYDMAGWKGGRDKRLMGLVDVVKERMASSATVSAQRVAADRAREQNKSRAPLIAGLVALLAIAVAGWFFFIRKPPVSPADMARERLAAIPCAWLQVDSVDDGSNGKLALTGVADAPERAGETIQQLFASAGKPIAVTTDRIARIGSAECPAIDVPRRLRTGGDERMKISSDGVGQIGNTNLSEARVQLAFEGGDKAMSLFGIEPSGKVTWVLPDYAALDALKDFDVGLVKKGERGYEFSLRSDHVGWTGLLLVTGDRELPNKLAQGEVQTAQQFASYLQNATREGTWDAEMVWYEIEAK